VNNLVRSAGLQPAQGFPPIWYKSLDVKVYADKAAPRSVVQLKLSVIRRRDVWLRLRLRRC